MNTLITVIGPSGVGKTTFVQALAKQDSRYVFANQMDYLLLRAEQEMELRASPLIGLTDGGLDLDFHGFTRLFLSRNLLNQNEYDLCRRFYTFTRQLLPPPELIVRLKTDRETVAGRLSGRRRINIASTEDTTLFDSFLDDWLSGVPSNNKIDLDVTCEDENYSKSVEFVLGRIQRVS